MPGMVGLVREGLAQGQAGVLRNRMDERERPDHVGIMKWPCYEFLMYEEAPIIV